MIAICNPSKTIDITVDGVSVCGPRGYFMDLLCKDKVLKLFANSRQCLLGISGGIDSMCMLTWFAKNRSEFPFEVKAIHVNHGINALSDTWAHFVEDRCRDLSIDLITVKVSLDGLGNNLEYAARKARYQAFCESGADSIVLAHHANDQCESFFLKLFRGSGIRGLKSMLPAVPCWYDESVTVLRPMLEVTRPQIELWAEEHKITAVQDPSNRDNSYDRNYIRNKIWPVITDRFGVADVNVLRSVAHIEEAWQLTRILADQDLSRVTAKPNVLDWYRVRDLGYLRIKNMVLRILELEGVYTFSAGQVEQFANGLVTANLDNRNQLLTKNLRIRKIGKRIFVERLTPTAADNKLVHA